MDILTDLFPLDSKEESCKQFLMMRILKEYTGMDCWRKKSEQRRMANIRNCITVSLHRKTCIRD